MSCPVPGETVVKIIATSRANGVSNLYRSDIRLHSTILHCACRFHAVMAWRIAEVGANLKAEVFWQAPCPGVVRCWAPLELSCELSKAAVFGDRMSVLARA